jgi:hypothetical protein
MDNRVLSESTCSHVIHVPFERVDIADWFMTLTEAEYLRCCVPDHLGFGRSIGEDGRLMSLAVETIGENLFIHHHVAEGMKKDFAQLVSHSDVITPRGRTQAQVTWELHVERLDAEECKYTNHVIVTATDAHLKFTQIHGSHLEQDNHARQIACGDHNRRETPHLAESIARRALSRLVS